MDKIDLNRYPNGRYYDRQATAATTIPPTTAEVVRQAFQTATYVVVIVTCLAVLVSLAYGWYEYSQVVDTINNFHEQISRVGG
jgi:hypothetical protein